MSKKWIFVALIFAFTTLGNPAKTPATMHGKNVGGIPDTGVSPEGAVFWYEKGAICAVYGNDRAAVGYFEKALKRDPQNSKIFYEIGTSYGEMSDYDKALVFINKAITLDPLNGLYFFGRGRVSLLSGQKGKAMDDFIHASSLGNTDARDYLRYIRRGD
jgi:tetratricopeptide (TPR) repeat protein